MRTLFINFLAGLVLLGITPFAAAEPDKERLILSCSELVSIYKTQSEKRLQAALTTSVSEALRAGYCRGVLEEHANHTRGCYSSDWLDMAKFIANQAAFPDNFESSSELLRMACNG